MKKASNTTFFSDLPSHHAAYYGDLEQLKKIDIGEINQSDERGLTPLHVAILSRQTRCAKYLIENGANLNQQTTVPLASREDQDRDRVKSIYYKRNVTEWELVLSLDKKITALHLAAILGLEEIVLLLCKKKAKVNLRSHGNVSSLHYAALLGHSSVVETLLHFKAKVSFKVKSQSVFGWFDAGMTALHAAAQSGNSTIISSLIEYQADWKALTKGGCGVILFAARSGNAAAVQLLLETGASIPTANPSYYNNPLEAAIVRSDVPTVALLVTAMDNLDGITAMEGDRVVYLWQPPIRMAIRYQNYRIIKLLLDAGAKQPTYSSIDDALFWGDVTAVEAKYAAGEKPQATNSYGYTPLYLAVEAGHLELVRFLLDNGYEEHISKQEVASRDKNTPLHVATLAVRATLDPLEQQLHWERSYQIARLLLERGANPNAVNYFENTPLHFPKMRNDAKMEALLLEYGATS